MAENFEITDEMRSVIGVESPPWTYAVTTTVAESKTSRASIEVWTCPIRR